MADDTAGSQVVQAATRWWHAALSAGSSTTVDPRVGGHGDAERRFGRGRHPRGCVRRAGSFPLRGIVAASVQREDLADDLLIERAAKAGAFAPG